MTQVETYLLWVGHAGEGRDVRNLYAKEIRAVVQLAIEERSLELPREMILCRFPLVDGCGNDTALLSAAIRSTAVLVSGKIPTLVCCGAGMSRSPAIAAAALSMAKSTPPEEALEIVSRHCPTDVLPGLWQEIVQNITW
ncbi:MAG TPA: hypothetical protein VN699_00725 [Pirellulales bacterium]|nr:hypothetical protein [Pirellulales bacterium]